MIRLDDLALFVRAAALGSFSAAAREVDLLPGQASAAIMRLERALDIRLFARSTRSLRLTAEGERYLPYARNVLETLREGEDSLRGESSELHGTLQIAAPSDFGRHLLLPWLAEFRRLHPRLCLRVLVSDQLTNVYRDPVDVAIRYGRMEDASFVALPLAPSNRRVLAAAPAYLAQRGRPATLEALGEHDCLLYLLNGRTYDKWVFHQGGRQRTVSVSGPLVSDDAEVVHRWAVAAEGIVYKSWLDISRDLDEGRLEILLGGAGEPLPLHLVCPHRKQFSPAIRQLHAFLTARCKALTDMLPALSD